MAGGWWLVAGGWWLVAGGGSCLSSSPIMIIVLHHGGGQDGDKHAWMLGIRRRVLPDNTKMGYSWSIFIILRFMCDVRYVMTGRATIMRV